MSVSYRVTLFLVKLIMSLEDLAKQRGERIKALRRKTGLNRKAFAKKHSIPETTLAYWEHGISQQITQEGLKRLVNAFTSENVECSTEYLITGISPTEKQQNAQIKLTIDDLKKQDNKLKRLIDDFLSNNINPTYAIIENNLMQPLLGKGDLVFGIKYPANEIRKFKNQLCLIETRSKEKSIKIVKATSIKSIYALEDFCPNDSFIDLSKESDLISIAPILLIKKFMRSQETD